MCAYTQSFICKNLHENLYTYMHTIKRSCAFALRTAHHLRSAKVHKEDMEHQ